MKYRELQKLNEIIENLKAHPNSDENIQFVLDLADKSVKIETVEALISRQGTTDMSFEQEQEKQAKFGLKFTNEEIRQMPKTFRKELIEVLNYYEVKPLEKKSTIRKIKEVKSKRITPKTESELEPKKKKRKRKKKTNEDNK